MKKTLLALIFICSTSVTFSQLDYLKMKDTICPTVCGILDSSEIARIYDVLLNLDTTRISYGMAQYYNDLSFFQYDLGLRNDEDNTFMRLHIQSTEKSLYHDPNNDQMLWNAALSYVGEDFRDCEKAQYYLNRYSEVSPKKYWKDKKDQIAIFLMWCPNDELARKFKIKENSIPQSN